MGLIPESRRGDLSLVHELGFLEIISDHVENPVENNKRIITKNQC